MPYSAIHWLFWRLAAESPDEPTNINLRKGLIRLDLESKIGGCLLADRSGVIGKERVRICSQDRVQAWGS
jgi:hypothetical protein